MSYSVSLLDDQGEWVADGGNHTSNCIEIWELALGFPLKEADRQRARLVEPALRHALKRLRDPRFRPAFVALHAPNGWGTTDGTIAFFEKFAHACAEHPDAIVRMWR